MPRCRADARFARSQWEAVLLCNDVSHWLGTTLESTLVVPPYDAVWNDAILHTYVHLGIYIYIYTCAYAYTTFTHPSIVSYIVIQFYSVIYTHIYGEILTIIGSPNDLSPDRCQAIIWTNPGILFIVPLETNFNEILIKIHTFSFK